MLSQIPYSAVTATIAIVVASLTPFFNYFHVVRSVKLTSRPTCRREYFLKDGQAFPLGVEATDRKKCV